MAGLDDVRSRPAWVPPSEGPARAYTQSRDEGNVSYALSMSSAGEDGPQQVQSSQLKPYVSVVVLRCLADEPRASLEQLLRFLNAPAVSTAERC